MKQKNLTEPQDKACVICGTLTNKPYGRNTYGDNLCSKKCCKAWDATPHEERYALHQKGGKK